MNKNQAEIGECMCIKQVHKDEYLCFSGPDSCSPVQEALCASSEKKKGGEPVSMGLLLFELETAKAGETLTDQIPGPSVAQIPQRCT